MKNNNFSNFLSDYQGGILDNTLGRELVKLVEAVNKHGKKGALSIGLDIKPNGVGKMELSITYNSKPPVDNTVKGLMFVDHQNNLVATDPAQQELKLQICKTQEEPLKREAI